MRRLIGAVVGICLLGSACGDEPSTRQYAEDLEALVGSMHVELGALDAEVAMATSLEDVQTYFEERRVLRDGFLADFKALTPSEEVTDLHDTAVGILERLVAAESRLADVVLAATSLDELGDPWATPEGQAARVADADTVALCRSAEERFDQSKEAAKLAGVPWVPGEMKQVVSVVLGCVPEDR